MSKKILQPIASLFALHAFLLSGTAALALAEPRRSSTGPSICTEGGTAGSPDGTHAAALGDVSALSPPGMKMVMTQVEVTTEAPTPEGVEGFVRRISQREVETSAGTFGDPSRFLQTLAGVGMDNDQRNDFLVRGGNPSENGFVIDNIEIPSINQLALSDTTGGFVSMLDGAAVQSITLHTSAYDSHFEQRLSSIVEVSTRPEHGAETRTTTEAGLAGAGSSWARPLGERGSLFVSARQGVLQYLTNDIGLNGVPHYRNAFVRADGRWNERNSWWGISLTGVDSMDIQPSATDVAETNPYDVHYSGWRNTTGVNWQHEFSARSFGVASVAYAQQSQRIAEDAQLLEGSVVYDERTTDRISTVKYDWTRQLGARTTLTAGGRGALDQIDYRVAQPQGLQNPYSSDAEPLNASGMARNFASFSSAGYIQASIQLPKHATLVLGERAMQWALGGHAGTTGKALLTVPVAGHAVYAGYAEYLQMPATLFLLSFNNARTLGPIASRQFTTGVHLVQTTRAKVVLEAYEKRYANYPVAAGLPQLSLANVADTFGQAFLLFPMISKGTGVARGVELTVASKPARSLNLTGTLVYARSWYAALDGVLRRGNYDVPLSASLAGVWSMRHGMALSARYAATSGKPYTPDNLPVSIEQNRDVYDLSRINSVRSSAYRRLDFRFEQGLRLGTGVMTWHAGLNNALGNDNFYAMQWEPRLDNGTQARESQLPRFPDGGVKYSF